MHVCAPHVFFDCSLPEVTRSTRHAAHVHRRPGRVKAIEPAVNRHLPGLRSLWIANFNRPIWTGDKPQQTHWVCSMVRHGRQMQMAGRGAKAISKKIRH